MGPRTYVFPPPPEIGRSESYYSKLIRQADAEGSPFAHSAAKVGQYITLALDPHLDWPGKLRYFQHTLTRHCVPPPIPDEPVWIFYHELADLVRQYAGHEALRLASIEDDLYDRRVRLGSNRAQVESEAEVFFTMLLGNHSKRPDWFNEVDWDQLKMLRNQWI